VSADFLFYSRVFVRWLPEQEYALHLEALAEALPLEVAATDAQGRVIVWNSRMERAAGPREAVLGRDLLEALPALASDPNLDWSSLLAAVLGGHETRSLARHPLGTRVVRATLGPLLGREGRVLGAALSLEDITSGAREEERRRREERVAAVHDLGASLAHEIRNPLNALSLNLQLLREELDDPKVGPEGVRRRADKMIAEARRMEALITHLLEVSRGGSLEPAPERLDAIVRDVVERLEGTARAAGCSIELHPGSTRTLGLDRVRIDRAVHNLVRNAVEAAAAGGGHVWLTTRDDPHSTVLVVDDDGPGIRPEDRSSVFVVFSTGKRGGTGLGLPLAREDVRRHGGEIEVLARPGGGARFVMHLPLQPAPASREPARSGGEA
jgi:signal transduction histidine kinase